MPTAQQFGLGYQDCGCRNAGAVKAMKPTPAGGPAKQIGTLETPIAFFNRKIKTGVAPGTAPGAAVCPIRQTRRGRLGLCPSAGRAPSTRLESAGSAEALGRYPLKNGTDENKFLPQSIGRHPAARRPCGEGEIPPGVLFLPPATPGFCRLPLGYPLWPSPARVSAPAGLQRRGPLSCP